MGIDSSAMSFVVFPFSLINIAICMDESSSAIRFVVLPVAFVARTI
jgi:hypothetical protein